jgi:hypothetical protein
MIGFLKPAKIFVFFFFYIADQSSFVKLSQKTPAKADICFKTKGPK